MIERLKIKRLLLLHILCILFLVSCGGGGGSTIPKITSFSVNKDSIVAGEVISLNWNTINSNRTGVTCDLWKDYKGEGNRKRISTLCDGSYTDKPVHDVFYTLSVNNIGLGGNSEIQTITQDKEVIVNRCQENQDICIFVNNLPDKKTYAFGELVYFDLDYQNMSGKSIRVTAQPWHDGSYIENGWYKGTGYSSSAFGFLQDRYMWVDPTSTTTQATVEQLHLGAEHYNEQNTLIRLHQNWIEANFEFKSCSALPDTICVKSSSVPKSPSVFNSDKIIKVTINYQNPSGRELFFGLNSNGENTSALVYPEIKDTKQSQKNGSTTVSLSVKPNSDPVKIRHLFANIFEKRGEDFHRIATRSHYVDYTFDDSLQ